MIGEAAFNGLIQHAMDGRAIRGLFITPNALERDGQKIDMINVAHVYGLIALWQQPTRTMLVEPAVAYLRIAHPHLYEELRGLDWHFIHGLAYLERLDDGDAIATNLTIRVRL